MDPQLLTSNLERLHLSQPEAQVYVALVEIGQTSAGEIIRKTVLHRSVVYNALDKLIQRKLVVKLIKKNISYYQPTNPDRILDNIRTERDIAESILPSLKSLIDTKLPEITVYEGLESYRRFWMDSIKRMPVGATDYVAGSTSETWYGIMAELMPRYTKLQRQKKIKWKMIVYNVNDFESELAKKHPDLYQNRLIKRKTDNTGNFNIFNGESVILHSTAEPMVIEIKNKSLVKVFQNIFDILWESGEEI